MISTKRRRGCCGSSMIEFAIGSTILVAAFTGTFQFGYIFYRYNTLENAVNAGANYASLKPFDNDVSTTCATSSAYSTAVKNMVVYGQPTTGTSPVLPGLQTSQVTVTPGCNLGVPTSVSVTINGYT